MRKVVVAGITGLIVALGATIALADSSFPSVSVSPTVTPNKAGTRKHPQGVKLKVQFHWQTLGEADQPIVTSFDVLFPKGAHYNGAHTPQCSLAKVTRGPQACPKASIMGTGGGTAYADTTVTHPKITVVNGGGSKIWFYTVLNNPARVQEPVIGHLSKRSGQWSYSLSVTIPQNLRIVAGVPIELTSLSVNAGKGKWLETTACGSGGHWPFSVTTGYVNPDTGATGSATDQSSTSCRK